MKVKGDSEKVGLKINIQKTKIMAPGPITSRQINGETVERVADFIFLSSKITADGDCSREIEKTLAPWKKSYNEPRQRIKKQGHYFANKGPSSQGYGEGNGSPLQFMPGESQGLGSWWAAVYGIARSWTRLNGPSSSNSGQGCGFSSGHVWM